MGVSLFEEGALLPTLPHYPQGGLQEEVEAPEKDSKEILIWTGAV